MRKKHLMKRIMAVALVSVLTVTSVNVPFVKTSEVAQAATVDTVLKSWSFDSDAEGWSYNTGWDYQYTGKSNTATSYDSGKLKVDADYSGDVGQSWSSLTICNNTDYGIDFSGANKISLDFIYDTSKLTTGSFTFKAYSGMANINSYVSVDTTKAVDLGGTLKMVPVEITFSDITSSSITDLGISIVGVNTDYKGSLWLDNINITTSTATSTPVDNTLKSWNFDNDAEGWSYNSGWDYQYSGTSNTAASYDSGKLKVDVDYSGDAGQSWSSLTVCNNTDYGINYSGANKITLDFIYDTSKLTTGSFTFKAYSGMAGIDSYVSVDTTNAVDLGGTLKMVPISITFSDITSSSITDLGICIIGVNTDYKGSLWLDNIKIISSVDPSANDIYVNSTVATGSAINVSVNNGNLTTTTADGNLETTALSTNVTMVDKDASDSAKQIYSYLEAMGNSSNAIFGQQNNTHHKAGSKDLSYSDTMDVTGSYTGVIGIDALSLTGNEYNASRYNSELGAKLGATALPETAAGNVEAAAALSNYNIDNGAIITFSAHMPNFSLVSESGTYDGTHTYSKYDFSGYSPNTLTGDVMNQILPGGKYNEVYNAYLDMIADYASQVNGAILFRPFHENTGSWFWWGAAFCDAATYKNVYKYTVEYLRDTKDIHNLIYVYGPSSEAANTTEYSERYPGDDYVDMVGFDMYNLNPSSDDSWFTSFEKELSIVQTFAEEHHKLLSVTETGVATSSPDKGDNQTALHKTGNLQKDWFEKVQAIVTKSSASYFLVWANFSEKDGFYTPYVKSLNADGTLYGHEMLDNFINFYNDPSSVFATNQKNALVQLKGLTITANPTTTSPTGYITSPVSGSRILEAKTITARVTGAANSDVVKFVLHGTVDKELVAQVGSDGVTYSAVLDADTLTSLGQKVGTIELTISGVSANTINATFNIPVPTEDPYQIDGFENYYGVDSLLTKNWATNKATGNTISLTLTKEAGKFYTGEYAMKFAYNETSDGWAGATISKTVDWSNCNALQFYTIPDGNNQKVVVQLTAGGKVYETYLNLYDDYKNSTAPMLVTIPFSDFCERDTTGNPKGGLVTDSSSVTSFGLWVNAISGSSAVVDGKVSGTIYYDDITAVKSSSSVATFKPITSGSTGGNTTTPGDSSSGNTDTSNGSDDSTKEPDLVITDLTTTTTTETSSTNSKLNTLLKGLISKDNTLEYIAVTVSGTIPKNNNKIKIYASTLDGIKAGSKVYVYAYNTKTNKLECLNKTTYVVDKDGYISVKANRAAQYVVLDQKVSGSDVLSRAEQTVVKKTLTVQKGKKANLNITMYDEYKNYATVTYKTSNKSVATVDKNGRITTKKKGTVTITTTVKIGSVTKKFTTKVTVK